MDSSDVHLSVTPANLLVTNLCFYHSSFQAKEKSWLLGAVSLRIHVTDQLQKNLSLSFCINNSNNSGAKLWIKIWPNIRHISKSNMLITPVTCEVIIFVTYGEIISKNHNNQSQKFFDNSEVSV